MKKNMQNWTQPMPNASSSTNGHMISAADKKETRPTKGISMPNV